MNKIKEKSLKASFGGIIAALSIVIMIICGMLSSLTYVAPAVCGVFLMIAVIEFSTKYSFAIYIAISILSLLIVPNKECAVMYAMFFGVYPILKGRIEGNFKVAFAWIVKYAIFNVTVIGAYYICSRIFNIPYEEIGSFGKYSLLLLLGLGNVTFFIYDIALNRMISLYVIKWQKYVKRLFR